MRLYVELARRAFQQTLAYRGATLAGIFTNAVFGVMISSVFLALYASRGGDTSAVQGWTEHQTITLVWINQALLMPVYMWGWWEVVSAIRTGSIITDLMKPYDYFTHWLARDLGRAGAHLLVRGLPTFLIGVALFDVLMPATMLRCAGFGVSVLLAVVVSFCVRFLVNLAGFWIMDHRGIGSVMYAANNVFSGFLAPIAFFPDGMRHIANVLPFRAIIMTPNEVYLGQVPVWQGLAFQAMWIAILVASAQAVQGVAERRLVVQGG
jgi:ABC-2 type transport system permease protein